MNGHVCFYCSLQKILDVPANQKNWLTITPKNIYHFKCLKNWGCKIFDQKNYGSKLVMQIMTSKTFHGLNDVSWII